MSMTYQDQVAIGGNLNAAIREALLQFGLYNSDMIAAIAQAVLVQIDQAGYQITRK